MTVFLVDFPGVPVKSLKSLGEFLVLVFRFLESIVFLVQIVDLESLISDRFLELCDSFLCVLGFGFSKDSSDKMLVV